MTARHRFTEAEVEYLRLGYRSWRIPELTERFNAWSGRSLTPEQLKCVLQNRHICSGRGPGVAAGERPPPVWRPEWVQWLRDHRAQYTMAQLIDAFAARWGVRMRQGQLEGVCQRHQIFSGGARFQSGHVPWNRGKTWTHNHPHAIATQFKPGNLPASHVPIWTWSFRDDDYWWVKVADNRDRDDWILVHRLVWLTERGPLRPSDVVVMIDGDPHHCLDVENLAAIDRRILARLNQSGWSQLTDVEERRAMLAMMLVLDSARGRARELGLSPRQAARIVPGVERFERDDAG